MALLRETFPGLPTREFKIIVHDNRAAMPAALQQIHHQGSPGFALLPRHEIHLLHAEIAGAGRGFWPVVVHELTHEFLHQHNEPWGHRLPRWFHEGLAQVIAEDIYLGSSEESIVWRAARMKLLGFSYLTDRFPSDGDDLRLAYAQSFSYVAWLERQFGRRLLLDAVAAVNRKVSFNRALVLATGRSTAELEEGWRHYLLHGSGARWRQVLGQCFSLSMILCLPLLALAMIRRMKHDAMVGRRLEAGEERPLPGHSAQSDPGLEFGPEPAAGGAADSDPRVDQGQRGGGQDHGDQDRGDQGDRGMRDLDENDALDDPGSVETNDDAAEDPRP